MQNRCEKIPCSAPLHCSVLMLLVQMIWLCAPSLLQAENLKVQIGNKDSYGDEAIYRHFTIIGQDDKFNSDSDDLDRDAIASIAIDYKNIQNLMWQYEGPSLECVLYPAQDKPQAPVYKKFNFITPEDLKTKLYKQITSVLSADAQQAWKNFIPKTFKSFDDIVRQSKENHSGIEPTPLQRFFMFMAMDCCAMQGWDGKWDSREADASTRNAYFDFINKCGMRLLEQAAGYSDAESNRFVAEGADALMRSYVRMRKDNSWRAKMVAEANGIVDWDGKISFVNDLKHLMKHLKRLYEGAPAGASPGLKALINQRSQKWDLKDQELGTHLQNSLLKLKVLMECGNSFDINTPPPDPLNELQLGELEYIIDALKLLYGA